MSDPSGSVGIVPLEGRGTLPLELLHGEPLLLHAVRSLQQTPGLREVLVTTDGSSFPAAARELASRGLRAEFVEPRRWWTAWASAAGLGRSVLVHDPLCPLVPADFVGEVLQHSRDMGAVAAYQPITDTAKVVVDEQIVSTLDRDQVGLVTSPVVVPGRLAGQGLPPVSDFGRLADWLRARGPLALVPAPSMGRRVGGMAALRVLECLDQLGRSIQEA
ncbi:2-C-methyl-D-erythritol 4-phosphate cytidylyltransferase [soil metagenome]